MKLEMFHLMPYRELPADFAEKYHSVWVDIPSHLFDPERANAMYNDTLDELEFAADSRLRRRLRQRAPPERLRPHAVAQHHGRQPRAPHARRGAHRARQLDRALQPADARRRGVRHARLHQRRPARRRLPGRQQPDTNFGYGINPATLRERYYEAEDLIVEAWTNPDVFAFNGKYTQLRYVNIWPRPLQQPHPPIWIPGGGSIETWGWCLEKSYLYAYLSYSGFKRGKMVMDGFWRKADELGVEPNPYHAGFLQLVAVGESESEVDEQFGPHGEYFYNKMLHVYPGFREAPGLPHARHDPHGTAGSDHQLRRPTAAACAGRTCWTRATSSPARPARSPSSSSTSSRLCDVGHLMVLNQFGSIPHDLAMQNIRLMGERVLPKLRHLWDGEWEDHWWIKPSSSQAPAAERRGHPRKLAAVTR